MGKSTLIGASVLAAAMLLAVSAQAGKPDGSNKSNNSNQPDPITECDTVQGEFKTVCLTNNKLYAIFTYVLPVQPPEYIGSCEPGGRGDCYESVAQKLGSAHQKWKVNKYDDAWNAACTILDDAYTWAYMSKKPKLTEAGYAELKEAVQALALYVNDKECPAKD